MGETLSVDFVLILFFPLCFHYDRQKTPTLYSSAKNFRHTDYTCQTPSEVSWSQRKEKLGRNSISLKVGKINALRIRQRPGERGRGRMRAKVRREEGGLGVHGRRDEAGARASSSLDKH